MNNETDQQTDSDILINRLHSTSSRRFKQKKKRSTQLRTAEFALTWEKSSGQRKRNDTRLICKNCNVPLFVFVRLLLTLSHINITPKYNGFVNSKCVT